MANGNQEYRSPRQPEGQPYKAGQDYEQPIDMEGYENLIPSVEAYKRVNDEVIVQNSINIITKYTDFLSGFYGPKRLGSPFGPQCLCGQDKGFHRTGVAE